MTKHSLDLRASQELENLTLERRPWELIRDLREALRACLGAPQEDAGKIAWRIIEEWQRDYTYPMAYEVRIDALAKMIANALRAAVLPPQPKG